MKDDLPPLREVIAAHDLRPKRSLGQNFLLDLNLTAKIARAAGAQDGGIFYEVGPGPGGLTRALLKSGADRVIAVERDARCLAALHEIQKAYPGKLDIVEGDALDVKERDILPPSTQVCANLPYNVGTALLLKWLTAEPWPPWWRRLTLMFQREVAERIVAETGSTHYGRLSVLAGWRTKAKILFDVNPSAFVPPPKVTSSVVTIEPLAVPVAPAELKKLEIVTAAAFGQRRKMLRQSLKSLGGETLLDKAGIDPTARAERLTVVQFAALARALSPG